jgi:hypothetical protein
MRYFNKKFQMQDIALLGMLKHLHQEEGIIENNCIYMNGNGDIDPNQTVFPKNKVELFVCAHGLRGVAGISNLGDDPTNSELRKEITAVGLALKINVLGIDKNTELVVKLPFCYGSLKMPSDNATALITATLEKSPCHFDLG